MSGMQLGVVQIGELDLKSFHVEIDWNRKVKDAATNL